MNINLFLVIGVSIIVTAAAVNPTSLNTDNYQVTYISSAQPCKLASSEDAYVYTILAEDYMAQTNLVSTIGASDPESYYETNIKPRQSADMQVIAPSVGLELSGEEVKNLFLTLSKRELAYHIWAMPRVCHLGDGSGMRVFLRETGLVQNSGEDVEGYGNVFKVFTTIELDFDEEGLVTQLVSVRDETLLGNEVFEGNAPRSPQNTLEVEMSTSTNDATTSDENDSGNFEDVDEEAKVQTSSSTMYSLGIAGLKTVILTFLAMISHS